MKTKIFLLIAACMAIGSTANAYEFSVVVPSGQTLFFNRISSSTVEVTSENTNYPYYTTHPTGDLVIPSTVTFYDVEFNVTSISHNAFDGCSGLTSVTIPTSVTWIGWEAFAFCSGLTSVTIPNSVTSISDNAFSYCSSLTAVTIPNSVTSMGDETFSHCTALNSVTIGSGVTSIGSSVFYGCSGLTSIIIPNNITSIGSSAFKGCGSLGSVTIPNSVISIGSNAFFGVRHIEYYGSATGSPWGAISMNGVTEGDFAYSDATKHNLIAYLGTGGAVTIPNNVNTIGSYAFSYCNSLVSVNIPDSVTEIGSYAFAYCSALTSVTLGSSVTSIGVMAFRNCSSLISITIPNSVTSINNYVFDSCVSLTTVTIGDSVTRIGNNAFLDCSGLTSVIIPNSVTTIGEYAFSGCRSLDTVYMMPSIPPILGNYAFANNASGRVFMLNGCSYNYYYTTSSSNCWYTYRDCLRHPLIDISVNLSSSDTIRGAADVVLGPSDRIVRCDSTSVIQAIANHGYHFTQWNDGVTDNPRTIALTQDTSFTAFFGINTYTVSVQSSDTVRGSVTGGATTEYLDTTTISATANYGFYFTQWNDGNTDNPRTVQVTDDVTYTAYFESTQGIEDIDAAEIKIYATEGRIVVEGAEGMEMSVFDQIGREVMKSTQNGDSSLLPAGVYLVKVGALPAKKVVVVR